MGKRAGTQLGAYTLVDETAELTHVLLAAGSEVHLAVEAAATLGAGCRVVSMGCMEVFEAQSDAYKAKILPAKAKTTAIEAGATGLWYKYADKVLGVDTFGESAPAPLIFEKKGITAANLAKVASAYTLPLHPESFYVRAATGAKDDFPSCASYGRKRVRYARSMVFLGATLGRILGAILGRILGEAFGRILGSVLARICVFPPIFLARDLGHPM